MTSSPSTPSSPSFTPVADHALLVEFATEISDAANSAVVALDHALAQHPLVGVIEVVPAFVNLLIDFDPVVTDHTEIQVAVRELLSHPSTAEPAPRRHTVQVCYDEVFAPDLPAVADACELSVEAVIDAHLGGDYHVVMYGFAPGYAYMAGVAGIDPGTQEAGTRAQGRCRQSDHRRAAVSDHDDRDADGLVDHRPIGDPGPPPDADRAFLFDPGDLVTFERIDLATFERLTVER